MKTFTLIIVCLLSFPALADYPFYESAKRDREKAMDDLNNMIESNRTNVYRQQMLNEERMQTQIMNRQHPYDVPSVDYSTPYYQPYQYEDR